MITPRRLCFLLLACAGILAAPCTPVPAAFAQAGNVYTDSVTGLEFPENLGRMARGDTQDFEKNMPGLGTSIAYFANDASKAHIYIYNMKMRGIPSDPENSIIEDELKRSAGEITAMEDKGFYSNVKELDSGTATMGKEGMPRIRYKKFSFRIKDGSSHVSYLLMTGYKGNFFKVRYSYPETLGEPGDKDALRFIAALGKVLKAGEATTQGGAKQPVEAEDQPRMKIRK
ncbi:MAG: hypothetical protein ACAI35_19140 [Candidatus Methylacidiphilales bacterium]